ncbi:hypothetical protein JCM6882_007784 [Rhodosporidiobolus microsporus]
MAGSDTSVTPAARPPLSLLDLPAELLHRIVSFLPPWRPTPGSQEQDGVQIWLDVATTCRTLRRICIPVVFGSISLKQLRHPCFEAHVLPTYRTVLRRIDLDRGLATAFDSASLALASTLSALNLSELRIYLVTRMSEPALEPSELVAQSSALVGAVLPLCRRVKHFQFEQHGLRRFLRPGQLVTILEHLVDVEVLELPRFLAFTHRGEELALAAAFVSLRGLRGLVMPLFAKDLVQAILNATTDQAPWHLTSLCHLPISLTEVNFINLFASSLRHLSIGGFVSFPREKGELSPSTYTVIHRPFPHLISLQVGYHFPALFACNGDYLPSLQTLSLTIWIDPPSRPGPQQALPPEDEPLFPAAQLAIDLAGFLPSVPSLRRLEVRMASVRGGHAGDASPKRDRFTEEEEQEVRGVCERFRVEVYFRVGDTTQW